MLGNKNILLIISGGIAAYKALELIRLLRKSGAGVRCILTEGGAKFVTPLSLAALSGEPVYADLWSLKDETEMGHIRLSREADLIVIAPASANLLARMAHGLADDLASTVLLAADCPVIACPAMNPEMWNNAATRANIEILEQRGIAFSGPETGDMACGETGAGRLREAVDILGDIQTYFSAGKPLAGKTALVTAGPTQEAIDPVRYVSNRSSGKQGYAIAEALAELGADVTLISGPTSLPDPSGIKTIRIQTSKELLEFCQKTLPVDIAVMAAAVADWTPAEPSSKKLKKTNDTAITLELQKTPDILAMISRNEPSRPRLVIGFAAETENLIENATAKRLKKGCDWLVANSVDNENPVFGSDDNHVWFVTAQSVEDWGRDSKTRLARKLAARVAEHFRALPLADAAE